MDRLYARFVRPGDLVFDIGAHVGDRVASFRRLGARVVAAEPQPAAAKVLKLLYGRNRDVAIEAVAVGRAAGTIGLMINPDNPTVSTASNEMVSAAREAPGWETQRWSQAIRVPITTLDSLMARHGVPTFIKIDVEGFEYEVLVGLSRPSMRYRSNSRPSSAMLRLLASNGVLRSGLNISTRRLAKVRRLCIPIGSPARHRRLDSRTAAFG